MIKSSQSDKALQRTFGPFDKVYGPESTQIQIYNEIMEPLVKEVLNGYNCTIFAYGQTGSGKTFTMEGRHDEGSDFSWDKDPKSGIIPRALHHIFSELSDQEVEYYTVRVSYIEMYNEQIYDLLNTSESSQNDSLRIFDDKSKGVSIVGMEEVAVQNRSEVYALLKRGAEKRRTASTLMNINSSRSHSVFTVTVIMREPGCIAGEELLRQGKLNLVDLAGSENIGRSGATLEKAREAGNINVSLLALGRVIKSLTTSAQHIPYRESKLTRILQDSLGGNTITTIIATLSPASSNFDESVSTLDYAQRAKNIKNNPECNLTITRNKLTKESNEDQEDMSMEAQDNPSKSFFLANESLFRQKFEQIPSVAEVSFISEQISSKIADLERRIESYEKLVVSKDQQIQQYEINLNFKSHRVNVLRDNLERIRAEQTEIEKENEQLKKAAQYYKEIFEKEKFENERNIRKEHQLEIEHLSAEHEEVIKERDHALNNLASSMGHQNQKQKITYVNQLRERVTYLEKENAELKSQLQSQLRGVLRRSTRIQKKERPKKNRLSRSSDK